MKLFVRFWSGEGLCRWQLSLLSFCCQMEYAFQNELSYLRAFFMEALKVKELELVVKQHQQGPNLNLAYEGLGFNWHSFFARHEDMKISPG